MKIGFGYDVHRFEKNRKLILGGVEIPNKLGLQGHSDADVLTHSIIDAILGALAQGDIGQHFPDSDEKYNNIDSRILLRKTLELMQKEDFEIGNLDVTICAEQPKLISHITDMRRNIAQDLNTEISKVSIKATTEEGLGFSGRQEGIKSYCLVLLLKK